MELDVRKRKILEAIIMDYIATAEPVGSRTISRKYNLGVSPATIRNEMADLEELGYLEQPHTSAGRVPSDLGYRYYVDFLMSKVIIDKNTKNNITKHYYNKINQLEDIIKQTSKILSQMTNYTALVLAPQIEQSTFQHIQLLLIEPGRTLVVIITDSGRIENRILEIPESVTKHDLDLISKVLNDQLKGLAVKNWDRQVMNAVHTQLVQEHRVTALVMELLDSILMDDSDDKVYLGGALNILNQPEFMDVEKAKNLFKLLEKEDVLANVMKEDNREGVNVRIGTENKYKEIQDCSIITATYALNGRVVGTIGVLGPTRMKYSHVVSAVEFLTQILSNALKNI